MSMKKWARSLAVVTCMSGVALAPLSEADAALNAYLTLKGQKTGQIQGSVTQKGREGRIMVVAVSHEIVSPRDAASGLPTGKRMHKPFVITKELDRSTPLLNRALVTNETLAEFELTVFAKNLKGVDAPAYTVKLTQASIAPIRLVEKDGQLYEEVSVTYQKIEWTWIDGGITAMDDWEIGVVKK